MFSSLHATIADRFRSLRHRDFRLFWSGQLVSLMGTWMQTVAQGWLMHRLTDSPVMLGALLLLAINLALGALCFGLLRSGWKIKA